MKIMETVNKDELSIRILVGLRVFDSEKSFDKSYACNIGLDQLVKLSLNFNIFMLFTI